ncbi:MAG TPA: ABC transporter permease [Polyangiaceae bacterium]
MLVPLAYNVRSLFVRKATTFATAGGIALVVFVLSSSLMLAQGIRRTMVSAGAADKSLVLRKGSENELSSSIETKYKGLILAAPGVKRDGAGAPLGAGEVVVVIAMNKIDGEGQFSNVQVRGIEPASLALRPDVRLVEGRPPQPGTDEAMVGLGMLGRFEGLSVGSDFEIKKNRRVKIVGAFESGGSSFESEVWTDIDTVRSSFGREGLYSSVTVQLESASKFDGFRATVENDKQLGLESFRENAYYEKQSEGTSIFISALGITVAVFFSIGAMIGAMITMYGAVSQRVKEIGTLQALGFSRLSVLVSFMFESTLLALIGGVLGASASLLMSFVSFSMMNFATWQEITFSFTPSVGILVGSAVAGGVMGILGGFFPAVRAARTSPIEAMRG